ncbi:MAG: thiamine phosphate synthase [Gammaproteobacteria bacterium]|nr:thiamine phosphate synthase [Pseudomonadota bacterium]MCH9663129.1 thiamine phosphate synthase [Gammaproteobacteria bacterium]
MTLTTGRHIIPAPGVYLVTPTLPDLVSEALWHELLADSSAVQWRGDGSVKTAARLRQMCREHGRPFIVNNDVDLCLRLDADGVHLGRHDSRIDNARRRLGNDAVIGASCYQKLDIAHAARKAGADYISFGACFASSTKPQAVPIHDQSLLTEACAQFDCPIVAIGGIDSTNCTTVLNTGVCRLAVCAGIFAQPDPAAALAITRQRIVEAIADHTQ